MNEKVISGRKIKVLHEPITDSIRVKDWIDIQLSLHKRKEDAIKWLSDLKISLDIYKNLNELKHEEWVILQYLRASLEENGVIYDDYLRYSMEEIMRINRALKKLIRCRPVRILASDRRLLYNEICPAAYFKVTLSGCNINSEKYSRIADVVQEGENLISYFESKERASRFIIKCLNQEDIRYLEMSECDEKTDI